MYTHASEHTEMYNVYLLFCFVYSHVAGNSVEVDESLFQEIEDLELDQDDPDFDPLNMDSDED